MLNCLVDGSARHFPCNWINILLYKGSFIMSRSNTATRINLNTGKHAPFQSHLDMFSIQAGLFFPTTMFFWHYWKTTSFIYCAKFLMREAVTGNTPAKILNVEKKDLQIKETTAIATAPNAWLGPNPAYYPLQVVKGKDWSLAIELMLLHCTAPPKSWEMRNRIRWNPGPYYLWNKPFSALVKALEHCYMFNSVSCV